MNETCFGAMVYSIVIALVFGFSLQVFSSNPTNCEGLSCQSYARGHCDSECAKIGEFCMGDPDRVYGACIGGSLYPYCYSIWELRCENGKSMGQISCYDYDPRCY